jgi:hypothetical protein
MLRTQQQAVTFVAVWTKAKSIQEAAAQLNRPPVAVNRIATYLRDLGVKLKHLPEPVIKVESESKQEVGKGVEKKVVKAPARPLSQTPLTKAQRELVMSHYHLVEAAARRYGEMPVIAGVLGYDGVHAIATDTLIATARSFNPVKFRSVPFAAYARLNIRRAVFKALSRKREMTGTTIDSFSADFDRRSGRMAQRPDEVAELSEYRARVEEVLGGPLDVGSSQGAHNVGHVNYGDLTKLCDRLGVRCQGPWTSDRVAELAVQELRRRLGLEQVRAVTDPISL